MPGPGLADTLLPATGADGRVESLTMVHGTHVDVDGVRLVTSTAGPATVAADRTTTDVDGELAPSVIQTPVVPELPAAPLVLLVGVLVLVCVMRRRSVARRAR